MARSVREEKVPSWGLTRSTASPTRGLRSCPHTSGATTVIPSSPKMRPNSAA
eukprot:CAMPEP_0172626818 /NCGR_PEP_ID=MMETSP1068-20121228/152721_1 /TAXON_ID=35684 /ORGANISM="Pseudopedinella elastica, Strain CCMP716" /LENGTH=51 /DNA_ID=CAMNT_0013436539 /DNA_START=11 /DNA_END=162 /DNA_ORIENTATION=-